MSLNSKVVCYWPFGSFGNLPDRVGGQELTAINTSSTLGKLGTATTFGATATASRTSAALLSPSGSFGFSFWIKRAYTAVGGGNKHIFGKWGGLSEQSYCVRVDGSGYIQWAFFAGSITSSIATALSDWSFVAVWYDSVAGRLYIKIDDNPTENAITGAPFDLPGDPFSFNDDDGGLNLGDLDDLAYYNDVLTEEDLETLWNGGSGQAYPFPEPLESTVTFSDANVARNTLREFVDQSITYDHEIIGGRPFNVSIEDSVVFDDIPDYPWFLLQEDGSFLLLEDSGKIELQYQFTNIHLDSVIELITFEHFITLPNIYEDSAEDTLTLTDSAVNHNIIADLISDTITFTETIGYSPATERITDTLVLTDLASSSFKVAVASTDLIFSDSVTRNNINRPSSSDILTFSHTVKSSIQDIQVFDTLFFFDTVTYQAPYKKVSTDDLVFSDSVIRNEINRIELSETFTLDDTVKTNVKLESVTDTISLFDTTNGRIAIRILLSDTLVFSEIKTEYSFPHAIDFITFTDAVRKNLIAGEAEDTITFSHAASYRGTIKESITDELLLSQVLDKNSILNIEVCSCLDFFDQGQSVKYASLSDTLTFSDTGSDDKWGIVVDSFELEQEVDIEGIDFADYKCLKPNDEDITDMLGTNENIPDNEIEPFEISTNIPTSTPLVDQDIDCGSEVKLLNQIVTETLTFGNTVNGGGELSKPISDNWNIIDFVVGFKIITRS